MTILVPRGIDLIRRLIAFNTTSRDSNLALIDFVRSYLAGHGVASELTFDAEGRKANLFATIGPEGRGGIMLAGHTDTVPVDGQDWHGDPFTLVERDGRLIGRGASDMKSFIGIVLAAVPAMVAARPRIPLHLGFTFDEEVGCIGVRSLLAALRERPVRPAACIIGEPTEMRPVTAHKGRVVVQCRVTGRECHSSRTDQGANAIEAAALLIARLAAMAGGFRDTGPFDEALVPAYSTLQTGRIEGGSAVNIVPRECRFEFELRHLPEHDPESVLKAIADYAEREVLPGLRRAAAEAAVEFSTRSRVAGLATPADAEIARLAMNLTGVNSVSKVSFGTEGGLYQEAGIPTVICGPGSIEQAHRPDEWIALDQILACERFIDRLIDHVSRA